MQCKYRTRRRRVKHKQTFTEHTPRRYLPFSRSLRMFAFLKKDCSQLNKMCDYMEYVKGGDILIAPSEDYEHPYVLKCSICEDYYGEFQQFFTHYLNHYDMESNEEVLSQTDSLEDHQLYDEIIVDEGGDGLIEGFNDNIEATIEPVADDGAKDTLSLLRDLCSPEHLDVKDETTLQDSRTSYTANDDTEIQSLEEFEMCDNNQDTLSENLESIDEIHSPVVKNKKSNQVEKSNVEYIQKFMDSKGNVMALIEAYKKHPALWNFNLPVKNRKKEKRLILWTKIATDLTQIRGLDVKANQVAALIIYLRQKYREKKISVECGVTDTNDILPQWAFKQLNFLKAFVENKPMALLDVHQDLSPKQTMQILDIYKKFPHLWDTNTLEFYCSNKRNEALQQMRNLIIAEMDLEVEETTLRNYLRSVRDCFVREKRLHMGFVKGPRIRTKNYERLMFLYDHLGPFQCVECRRTLLNPLQMKVHASTHDDTIPLKCSLCQKEFKIADTYVFHIRRHMGDLTHECTMCDRKFLRVVELTSHMRCHTGDKPFCCDVCGTSFRHRTGFSRHLKLHGNRHTIFCPYCSKGFYSRDSMNIHIKTHRPERDYVCTMCGKAFKTRKTLKSHIATHENGNYECPLCGKSFKNKINLWQHKRKHRSNASIQAKSEKI